MDMVTKTPKLNPNYWAIHGDYYDLNKFAKEHPGGAQVLEMGKGRDCTELFESVHAIGNIDKARLLMKKYKVVDEKPQGVEEHFLWKEGGFYDVLGKRVRERFKGRNYKVSWLDLSKIYVMFVLYIYCWYQAFILGNIVWAVGSGILTEMIGFCLLHEASHNAFSLRPSVNYLGLQWCGWMLWSPWLWLQHHCYGHHSFTGLYGKDPDVHNVDFLGGRKHITTKKAPISSFQHYFIIPVLAFSPGQHIAQILYYAFSPFFSDKIFSILQALKPTNSLQFHFLLVASASLIFHFFFPLYYTQDLKSVALAWIINYVLMGVSYWACVAPNHDTISTFQNHPSCKVDWGEQQVTTFIVYFFFLHFTKLNDCFRYVVREITQFQIVYWINQSPVCGAQ